MLDPSSVQSTAASSATSSLTPDQQAAADGLKKNASAKGPLGSFTSAALASAQASTGSISIEALAKADLPLAQKILAADQKTFQALMDSWSKDLKLNEKLDNDAQKRYQQLKAYLKPEDMKALAQAKVFQSGAQNALARTQGTIAKAVTPVSTPAQTVASASYLRATPPAGTALQTRPRPMGVRLGDPRLSAFS